MSEIERKEQSKEKQPTLGMSILILVLAVIVLMVGILVLQLSPHIPILACAFLLSFYGLYLKISWKDMMLSLIHI